MKKAERAEVFEDILMSYAEMCYSVAFALTRNPRRAEELARYVLTWAWRRHGEDGGKGIKRKLLYVLRERFLQCYCPVPFSGQAETAFAERM